MILDLVRQTRECRAWLRRRRALRGLVRETIEGEGGEVLRVSNVGLFLRSPFAPSGYRPIRLRAKCRYPHDEGSWFVRQLDGEPPAWVWRSRLEGMTVPEVRKDGSFVDDRIGSVPEWVVNLVGLALLSLLVFIRTRF